MTNYPAVKRLWDRRSAEGRCCRCGTDWDGPTRNCRRCLGVERLRRTANRYGVSMQRAAELLEKRACIHCGDALESGRDGNRHIDHDHDTGEVRGVLCRTCNLRDVLKGE